MPDFNSKYTKQETGVVVQGLAELQDTLKRLPDFLLTRVVKQGMKKAATVIKRAVQSAAPRAEGAVPKAYGQKPGDLAKSITVSSRRNKRNLIQFRVGVNKKGFYGRFVEAGHRVGSKGKRLARRGTLASLLEYGGAEVKAHPFVRPAFDSNWKDALNVIAGGISGEIDKLQVRELAVSSGEQALYDWVDESLGA